MIHIKHQLGQLIIIRFKEFIREPGIIFWSIIFPVLMAWVLGIAFTRQPTMVQHVAIQLESDSLQNSKLKDFLLVADTTQGGAFGKEYVRTMESQKLGDTRYKFSLVTAEDALLMIKRGITSMIILDNQDTLSFRFDPQSPDAKLLYITLSNAILEDGRVISEAEIKPLTQKGGRYIDFLVPGLIAMGLMNSIMWGISYALIDMRVKKLLRRMVATPMKKSYFMVSHFVARLLLGIIEAGILFGFAHFYFDTTIQGSAFAFVVVFFAGTVTFSGIAILIASRVNNSRVGTGLINVITLPMTILSGIFFSYHNFPDEVIPIIQKLPLTMLADSIRAIFIEGAGLADVWLNTLILFSIGIATFLLGLRIYKWY